TSRPTHPALLSFPTRRSSDLARESLDAQWLVEVLTESFDRSGDVGGVAPQDRQVTEPATLLSHQEPVDNFPRDQRHKDPRFGGRSEEHTSELQSRSDLVCRLL